MASSLLLIAAIAAAALLISPATSQTCKSQAFTQPNTRFANCTDLPHLRAHLHWTYDPSARPNPTLSIAFIAPPARPEGWVAWALNPTATGMVGAQSLIAFRDTNGSVVVRTYSISSYSSITESRLSYDVLSKRAEYSGGEMRIFATLAMPRGVTEVNQVWQVGASVSNGVPVKHDFSTENLSAREILGLGSSTAEDGDDTVAPSPSNGGPQDGNDTGGSSRICWSGLGLYGALVLVGVVLGF
ncbi:hypothetical protein CDL12_26623 [Handroanthus impetiginosus]|uniref:DOMON domain-containing protein n=1 Tax=Handroanthus impetiginosus TaxID=429701 RepID=A0A2G9G6D3_9LAMI|nr:hypothetical protein CDL12_26623 [Handroanthus impetiginosus]